MKQLLILSGKGGTGKTTIASAFIRLLNAKAFADCDVDAPNLHLLMNMPSRPARSDYYGMGKAGIDQEKCTNCKLCLENCKFKAIKLEKGHYRVDYYACEACGVCEEICPVGAVKLYPHIAGQLELYIGKKIFSTGRLKMGSGTSGKLVSEVKRQMVDKTDKEVDIAIIDGSPGIGCPVIASLSGVDMVLIVAEPSISGIEDMKRIIETAKRFNIKIGVSINKYNSNLEKTKEIQTICQELNIDLVGKIPFDYQVVNAINTGNTIIDLDCIAGDAVRKVFNRTMEILKE